jgi:hypothetical protein
MEDRNGNVVTITLSPNSAHSVAYDLTIAGEDISVCGVQGSSINLIRKLLTGEFIITN